MVNFVFFFSENISCRYVRSGKREHPLVNCPPGYMELIEQCWSSEFKLRPRIEEILAKIVSIRYCMVEMEHTQATTSTSILHGLPGIFFSFRSLL